MEELKAYLYQKGELISVPKGEILYFGGEIPEHAYLVVKGLVKVYDYDRMGEEFVYSVLKSDTLFLGVSTVLRRPKQYSYQALTDLSVYRVPYVQMRMLMRNNTEIMYKIMCFSAETHSKLAAHVRSYSMQSPVQRIAGLLLAYSAEVGVAENGVCKIAEKISMREMGPLIGASFVTVSRAMSKLCDQGLVGYIDGYYRLFDLNKLSALANCDEKIAGGRL